MTPVGNDERGVPSTSQPLREGAIYQHAFLQMLMQRGFMTEAEAKKMHSLIFNVTSDDQYLATISAVNANLSTLRFELRRVRYPGNDSTYIGFVNLEPDEPSKRATKHRTKDGRPDLRYPAYFKALVDHIASHPGSPSSMGWVSITDALNVSLAAPQPTQPAAAAGPSSPATQQPHLAAGASGALPAMRLEQREEALACFVADGWLSYTPDQLNCYSLGPRALLELGPSLLENEDLGDGPKRVLEKALGYG